MTRTITVNYAKATEQQHTLDPITLADTITVTYAVGYKNPASGVATLYPALNNQTWVSYMSPSDESRATTISGIMQAIAKAEGLVISGPNPPDSIELS